MTVLTHVDVDQQETCSPSLEEVLIDRIVAGDNVRHGRDEDKAKELLTSIRENGILAPPHVQAMADNTYKPILGFGRIECARRLGYSKLNCFVHRTPLTEEQIARLNVESNEAVESLNAVDLGMYYADLLQRTGKSVAQLAEERKASRRKIARCVRIATEAPEELLQFVRQGRLESSKLEIVMKTDPSCWLGLSERIIGEKMTRDEVNDFVRRTLLSKGKQSGNKSEEAVFRESGFLVNVKSPVGGASLKALIGSLQSAIKNIRLVINSASPDWPTLRELLRKKEEQERLEMEQAKMQASLSSIVNGPV